MQEAGTGRSGARVGDLDRGLGVRLGQEVVVAQVAAAPAGAEPLERALGALRSELSC